MAKYSRFDSRNKKKGREKYRGERKFSQSRPKDNMKQSEDYEAFDLPSLRRRQKA